MRIHYLIFLMIPVLLVFSAAPSCTFGDSGACTANTCIVRFNFCGTAASAPLTQTATSNYQLSPTSLVNQYNAQNALYLLSCPVDEHMGLPSPMSNIFFQTSNLSLGDYLIGGNRCDSGGYAVLPPVNLTLTDSIAVPDPTYLPNSKSSEIELHITNATVLSLTNLGFSPEVVTPTGNFVSTDFDSHSYIFDGIPAWGQQGIWTWNGKYLDLGFFDSDIANGKYNLTAYASQQSSYVLPSTTNCTAGPNILANDTSFYEAYFGEALAHDGYPVTANNIEFLELLTQAEGEAGTGTYLKGWNPIGLYTVGVANVSEKDNGPCGTFDKAAVLQDVYSNSSIGANALERGLIASRFLPGGEYFGATIVGYLVNGSIPIPDFISALNALGPTARVPAMNAQVLKILNSWAPDNNAYLDSYVQQQLALNLGGGGEIGGSTDACIYTYTINSEATLTRVEDTPIPFPLAEGGVTEIGLLPYITYNPTITNLAPANEFNIHLSYDIYSPLNYFNPQNVIEPFTINSMPFFFSNETNTTQLNYFNTNGLGVDLSGESSEIGTYTPIQTSNTTTSSGGSGGAGSCPNRDYPPFEEGSPSSGQLNLQQLVDCAASAGFTGDEIITVVSMAYAESSWQPGEFEGGGCAAGILQEGATPCMSSGSLSVPTYFSPPGYDPSTCSTNPSGGWQLYTNPLCSFNWAYAEFKSAGDSFATFWGSYNPSSSSPPYCLYAPSGWNGGGSYGGRSCPSGGQNEEGASWSTVCPGNVCKSSAGGGGGSTTTTTSTGYALSITPSSITAIPQDGVIFVMGTSTATSGSSSSSGGGAEGSCASDAICDAAYSQLGVPYCYGGEAQRGQNPFPTSADGCNDGLGLTPGISTTSGGFDCSGLVQWAILQAGLTAEATAGDHYTVTQFSVFTPISQSQTEPGDLVFFNDGGPSNPGHVGICYNAGCTEMIDAPETGTYVRIDQVSGFLPIDGFRRVPGNNPGGGGGGGGGGNMTKSSTSSTLGSGNCPVPLYGMITEQQFIETALCATQFEGDTQYSVYALAIDSYYASHAAQPVYAGDPLLSFGAQPWYNPIYLNINGTVSRYSSAQQGLIALVSQLAFMENETGGTFDNGAMTTIADSLCNGNTQCTNDVSYAQSHDALPGDAAGKSISQWINIPVPDGSITTAQNSDLTLQQQAYQDEITQPGINLYMLKVIPTGYYNTSLYQPVLVKSANTSAEFSNNWDSYWSNVTNLQGESVYVDNAIPITSSYAIYAALTANATTLPAGLQFTPMNMSTDSYGDVYITGYDGDGHTWLVKITNTIGPGPVEVQAASVCPIGSPRKSGGATMCNYEWDQIAVSPTGSQIYLANYESGYIQVFDSNLDYVGNISLAYSTDSALFNGALTAIESNPYLTKAQLTPNVNIVDYLENGGLYGIGSGLSSGPFPSTSVQPNFCPSFGPGPGHIGCSLQDEQMKTIIGTEEREIAPFKTNIEYDVEFLDKADYGAPVDNNNYHHPISIQDVDGYLYVLDYWSGITGRVCTSPPVVWYVYEIISPCSAGSEVIGGGGWVGGIAFGMLTLRLINSSGVDVPISPTYYNDLWVYKPSNQSCAINAYCETDVVRYTGQSQYYYPPYGWILSANVSKWDGGYLNTSPLESLDMCGANGEVCGQEPNPLYYPGTYAPVGPELWIYHASAGLAGCGAWGDIFNTALPGFLAGGSCGVSNLVKGYMSLSFNNSVTVFIPSLQTVPTVVKNISSGSPEIANRNNELLIATFPPENYTKSIGGNTTPVLNYICYTSSLDNSSTSTTLPGICEQTDSVNKLWLPEYLLNNPFEYDSNFGAQRPSLDSIYASGFSAGNPFGFGAGTGCSGLGNVSGGSATFNSCANASLSDLGGTYSAGYGSITKFNNTINNISSITATQEFATTLNTTISGYAVLPYWFDYNGSWNIDNITAESSSCPPTPPSNLTHLKNPTQFNGTVYTYTASKFTSSNLQSATVEGADTYARSSFNSTVYYQAQLNATIIPNQLLYNILSNRIFGKLYINSTLSPYTNKQDILNATTIFTYLSNTLTQGGLPGYEYISLKQVTACTGIGSNIGVACAAPLANAHNYFKVDNAFSNMLSTPAIVPLFDWYKLRIDNLQTSLTLNGSSPSLFNAYGYHRIVYVLNDRFNNTIYMPLDADISNETYINLNVTPEVNATNPNRTVLHINGTLSWTPEYTGDHIRLKGGYVYVYYDTNLNTIGYNASRDPQDAALCAFGNMTQTGECALANPVLNDTGYTLSQESIHANIITYSTQFNSSADCAPPPNSLLTPANQIWTFCNIYPNVSAASNPHVTNLCPRTAQGATQYCAPVYANGTGICTSQMGLIGIYKTNSSGYFNTNVTACGVGSAKIIAQYYGAPTPQPISAKQSPLGYAANPSYGASGDIPFTVPNYTWSPATSAQSFTIGSFLLSLGSISVLPIILLVCASLIAYGVIRHRTRKTSEKGRRKP